jgi:hypothetical protein
MSSSEFSFVKDNHHALVFSPALPFSPVCFVEAYSSINISYIWVEVPCHFASFGFDADILGIIVQFDRVDQDYGRLR